MVDIIDHPGHPESSSSVTDLGVGLSENELNVQLRRSSTKESYKQIQGVGFY